eukprot:jgi/Chrzof1/7469/Cz02g25040.t1
MILTGSSILPRISAAVLQHRSSMLHTGARMPCTHATASTVLRQTPPFRSIRPAKQLVQSAVKKQPCQQFSWQQSRAVLVRSQLQDRPPAQDDKPFNGLLSKLGAVAAAAALVLGGFGAGIAAQPGLAEYSQSTTISSSASQLEEVTTKTQEEPVKQAEQAGLLPEEVTTIKIFQRNTPSVVNITNIREVSNRFYSMDTQKIPTGTGSGFIWDDKGHVITNFHVIKGASEVKVTLLDQSSYTAKVVGIDPDKDVAVLQLQMADDKIDVLRPVSVGSSGGLLVGQKVFAIGNPFGLDHTITQGIISGLGRELNTGMYPIKNVIQTDAAINPGNSGGVLLDSGGRLIGINTAIADPTGKGASSGVGFAIPIDTVKGLVDQILQYGRVMRPALGITIAPPQVLQRLGQQGVLILEAPPGSPASDAGLQPTYRDKAGNLILGDVIVGLDGQPVNKLGDLLAALDAKRVGDQVQLEVMRDGQRVAVGVKLGERVLGQGAE